jgi:diguanylate cyclase (GGDEF)-like protein/PAS domain S-box-containing protein
MSASSPLWTVVGALLAAAAVAALLRRSRLGGSAYRWLAAAAGVWGAAFVAQLAAVGAVTPTAIQLSLTDVLALLALVPLVVGLLRLAPADRTPDWPGQVVDGGLLSLSVFAAGWIIALRPAYAATDIGAGSFIVDLIHPMADLVVLAAMLAVAARAGRIALWPYLSLAAVTVGDLLAVQARADNIHAGGWAQVCWLVALGLLGAAGLRAWPELEAPVARRSPPAVQVSTVIGLTAAVAAAISTLIFAVVTWRQSGPVPLIIGSAITLVLAGRAAGLLLQSGTWAGLAASSGGRFLQLADRTSDVVLLCDSSGVVTYASRAIARYGYEPGELTGKLLLDFVHPDDQAAAVRAAEAVAAGQSGPAASIDCRVRAADATWRHVQASLARYAGQDAILVTARDVSDQVALRRQVTHLTFHDGLTGLPNRAYLEDRAKALLSRPPSANGQERAAAIFVDLDGFTAINDSVGHGAGDLLLAQAGRRLRGLIPSHDTVARWGGDEFAILVERAATPQEIVDMAERLGGAIAATPFEVADHDIPMTASLGVAFAEPDTGDHLLRYADLAMARAKEAGGGRVEVFAAHMHADVTRRLDLTTDLRQAIADGALDIEYQPLVELATGRVAGVEALVRWTRNGEPVPTAEFLGIAEESGLIISLGEWVLREACTQAARWRAAGWNAGLSINYSLRQVSAVRFAESVLTTLDECGLARSALTLEVNERVLIESEQPMIDDLARLRQLGVRLAIDDFGTGYASLAYLRELPVDIIKIDPSFVAGLGRDATLAMLTRTIVQVGHDLGIEIVAEGIERPEQLELLRAMGCGLGQGYLVARPMTAEGIEALPETDGRRAVSLLGQDGPTLPDPLSTDGDGMAGPDRADPDPAVAPAG